jgi:hypothetical protein
VLQIGARFFARRSDRSTVNPTETNDFWQDGPGAHERVRWFTSFRIEAALLAPLGGGAMLGLQSLGHAPSPSIRRAA